MKFVSRSEWSASSPQHQLEPFGRSGAQYVIISQYNQVSRCTSIDECCANMRDMQSYHMNEKGDN